MEEEDDEQHAKLVAAKNLFLLLQKKNSSLSKVNVTSNQTMKSFYFNKIYLTKIKANIFSVITIYRYYRKKEET